VRTSAESTPYKGATSPIPLEPLLLLLLLLLLSGMLELYNHYKMPYVVAVLNYFRFLALCNYSWIWFY